ncbi:MAG: efflux RND transporter periplasmic adaptor subunit [Gemmobacter sp.]
MRIVPVIIAAVVSATLYLLVMERDALQAFASRAASQPGESVEAEAPPANPNAPAVSEGERRVPVVALDSRAQSIDNAVLLRGRTEAARHVELRAETSGRVVSDPLRRGAYVNEGDILCRIDAGTRPAALAEAQARLAEAELAARNAEQLQQGGFAAETRTISARAALQSARTAVENAEREIARLEIRAPFSGLLESDAAELGTLLQPGALCATVIQLDPIRLVGYVAEADVDRIEIGAMAGGRLATGREVSGRVTFLARSADPMTRTFRVDVTVPNHDLSIRDGQTVEMLVMSDGVSAHLVPASALTLDDRGVLGLRAVDEDSRARFLPVSVVRDTVEGVWVKGLPDAVRLIVVGQEFVTEGTAVEAVLRGPGQ